MKPVAFLAALGAATLSLAFVLVALRGEDDGAQAAPPAQAATVQVTLQEFSVTANPSSAPAGDVDFVASNAGSVNHELVIIRTDLAPDALPVVGSQVDESAVQVIDEIPPFAPGTQQTASTNLATGAYVLICNVPTHYQAGMRTGFTVTEGTATATTTATATATATETATTTATATPTPTATATATATPTATATTTPVFTASPISATVTPSPTIAPTQTATTPAPTTPSGTATPIGTTAPSVATPAAPPPSGGGGVGGDGGVPAGVWTGIGGVAVLLAAGAAGLALARRRSTRA